MPETKKETAIQIAAITSRIKPLLTSDDWQGQLVTRSSLEKAAGLENALVDAQDGMGYCIDERKIRGEIKDLKPGFVGGAAGWMVLFMSTGKSFNKAVLLTKQLYEERQWGQMEGHIDDDHGQITDHQEIAERTEGCGFLGVWRNVFEVMKQSLGKELRGQFQFADTVEDKKSPDFITAVRKNGGNIVALTKAHKKAGEVAVAINLTPGKTLDRTQLFDSNPAFLWDAWKSTDNQTLDSFNSLAETNLTSEGFFKLQASMHLATGLFLGVLKLDGAPNLAIIQKRQ